MTPEFDDVLLTAYLDEEVNDTEREKVEEQLRTSAASRKLLEELRSVRNLVTLLHSTQSTRSYQQGPWSQANLAIHEESSSASEMSKVVRQVPRSRWKFPFQRIASIAALIAIAVCGRILLLQPNKPTISRSDGTSTSTDAVRSLSQEPIPRSPQFEAPNGLGDLKSKSQFSENKPSDPAAGAVYTYQPNDSPSLAKKPTDRESQKPSSKQSEQIVLDDLFLDDLLRDQSQEWKKRNVQAVESLDRKSSDWVDHFFQQENSNSPNRDEPITKFYFRYRKVNQLGRVIDEPTVLLRESASTKESEAIEFDKQLAEKQRKVVERPSLVEFEIPSNDWESGAKRLRQMGISVPLELPTVEYLEFTGIPIPSVAKMGAAESVPELSGHRPENVSRVAGSLELSRWTFQPTDPLEGQRSLERLTERPSSIRIRVRAISTTEK